jgi:hypothetical protein
MLIILSPRAINAKGEFASPQGSPSRRDGIPGIFGLRLAAFASERASHLLTRSCWAGTGSGLGVEFCFAKLQN